MDDERAGDVTEMLVAWANGSTSALHRLFPVVYAELHRVACGYMAHENCGNTLQPTALVHEAYLKLIDQRRVQWHNRAHFFGIAAQAMRRILVDRARRRATAKRGAGAARVPADEVSVEDVTANGALSDESLLVLDQALTRLAKIDEVQGRVVELRYFGGLTIEEAACVLTLSTGTVKREWRSAKAWLRRELETSAGQ